MPAGEAPPRGPAKPPGPPPAKPPGTPPPAAAAASAASGVDPAAATTRVPGSEGDEAAYAEEWAGWTGGGWWRQESSTWDGGRGLDAGLSKTTPSYELLKTDGYRRGTTAISEGAFLVTNSLQGEAAEATEEIDLDLLETDEAFRPLFKVLDEYYKYDNWTELPARTDQFFGRFARQEKESMKLCCLRHQRDLRKLKEVGMEIPDMLAGWHLLTRAAIPPSGAAQVRSQCVDGLSWQNVKKALLDTYGAEGLPDKRDIKRVEKMLLGQNAKDDAHYTNDYEWERGLSYEDTYLIAEEPPQDVEDAQLARDEAYLSFVDAKKRVAEIAKSRRFYPIVAVAPDNNYRESRPARAPGIGKGRGRGKGKGSSQPRRDPSAFKFPKTLFARSPAASSAGSTGTGSTQQRGPRFKRFRRGGFTKTETESGNMVEDVETLEYANSTEEVFLLTVGKGISDGGATRPVMDDKVWAQWEKLLRVKQLLHEVKYEKSDRRFRFGDGKTLEAKKAVTLSVWPFGITKQVATRLVEGWTPLLIARPCAEEWGLIRDYRAGAFMMKDLPDKGWMKSERDEKGHFIIDLLGSAGKEADDAMNEGAPTGGEESSDDSTDKDSEGSSVKGETDDGSDSSVPDADAYYLETAPEFYDIGSDDEALTTERFSDMDADTYSDLILALEQAETDMRDTLRGPRERVVWEVFVDQGALSEELLEFPQVKVIQFRLADGLHWQTKTWQELPGCHCRLDQRRLGARFEIQCQLKPCQKPTRLQSANKELVHHVNMKCSCTEEHGALRGKLAQQAQNYPRPMARRMAYLVAYQGMADDIEDINTAEEVSKDIDAIGYTDVMQELMKRFNVSTIREVKRAHISLGHPSNAALATAMKHAKAPAEWLQCAKLFQCEVCLSKQRPRAVRVAVLPTAKRFNEVVNTDVYYVTCWAGKPDTMRMDMAGSHTSRRMHQWMSKHNITLDLNPKGAHHKLGLMERNHAVKSEQLSKYHLQFPDDSLKTALRMTASQRNILRNARGYSPATLVLGTQPKVPGALCDEDFGLAEQAALVDPKSEVNEDDVMHTSVAWVTHGRTIYRCTVEQLRPELPSETREREGRREDPDSPLSTIEKLRRALRRTKGTCSFSDLAEGGQRPQYDDALGDMGAQQPDAQGVQQERRLEPIDEAEVDPAARCPLRFLLKWKVKDGKRVANARVLYQGFKHRDVAEGQLDKEAPTLSRLGRHTVLLWAALRKWRLFAADVKSAFLQAEDVSARGIKLYASPTKEIFDGQTFVVDGLIGKRAGDFIGCGENVSCEDDLYAKLDDTECFQARLGMLNEKFKFGKWEFGPSLVFTGGEVEQSLSSHAITIKFEKYLHAVKPITVETHRRADPTSALSPKGVIIAAATASFRAASTGHATVQDLLDANKDLRLLKANADVGLYFGFDRPWSELRVGGYSDASWASRPDGSSQGGYQIFVGPEDELNAGAPTPFVAMEWASKKLVRLCKSSLSAEAQAAAMGADSLMWVKVFLALSLRPDLATAGLGIAEKRTAIEMKIVNEQLAEVNAGWKWVNTQQQMTDELTKLSARQMMADALRRGVHALRYDPDFVAGKKLTKRAMEQREKELDQAGEELLDTFEKEPVAKAKAKARTRHFGANGARLAAALAATRATGSGAEVVQYTPSGVELFHPPTNDGWDNLLVKLAMFGLMMAMLVAFGCGFWVGTCWTRWTTTDAEQKSIRPREPETEPNPSMTTKHYVEGAEMMTTGVNTKQPRQKKVRHMMCQAQCRYNQDAQTPRFQPLPEYAHGAFIG
ncbi:unnamed protein product [Prorocentrum cordatum]|uniref:Copia protein n=2 Tax=Prorocentrum cordatum TaxID=2364126 RepID=A0ABN9PIK2_9DINO|nr:unnamed protein product [Polarella glacialis]